MDDISQSLTAWRDQIPHFLRFNFDYDVPLEATLEQKIYQRQALALQLTYDNILIILHRPIMAQQVDSLCKTSPASTHNENDIWPNAILSMDDEESLGNPLFSASARNSQQQRWAAAVRISCITKLPNTAQLATDSHLVGFLGIILFNSAIVMVVYALSDLLSDRAQEAKRNLTRIYRLEDLLGTRSSLSRQSSVILQDVIQLLLDRESQEMLGPVYSEGGQDGDMTLVSHKSTAEKVLHEPPPGRQQCSFGGGPDMSTNPGLGEILRLNRSLSFVQRGMCTNRHAVPMYSRSQNTNHYTQLFSQFVILKGS